MRNPSTSASERGKPAAGERLQKVLARAGVASRRQCETYIVEGRVRVNGQVVTELGTRVDPLRDRLEFDGRRVDPNAPHLRYYVLYKPTGYLSTVSDPHGRPTVLELVPSQERLYPVGRLDYNSEGLMLLTNDGELTHRLLHPRFQHEREYVVLIPGPVSDEAVERLRSGVPVGDPPIVSRAQVEVHGRRWHWRNDENPPDSTWLRMTLREGHKREIRYMLEAVGYEVQRLIRVRFDLLELGDLQPGDGRWLTPAESGALRKAVGLTAQPLPLGQERTPGRARIARAPREGSLRGRPSVRRGPGEPAKPDHEAGPEAPARRPRRNPSWRERRPAGRRPASTRPSRRPRPDDTRQEG